MQRSMVKSPCNRCKEKEAARNAHHGRPGRRLSERAPRPDPPAPKGEMHARSVPHSVLAQSKADVVAAKSHLAPVTFLPWQRLRVHESHRGLPRAPAGRAICKP